MSDDSLFREVDEEVRQEQIKQLWDRYGTYIVALCAVIVIGVAAFKGWQYWQLKQAEAASVAYGDALKLVQEGKRAEADQTFAKIDFPGYARLAKLRHAANLAIEGKPGDAVKLYDDVAADGSAAPSLRDLARIRAGYLLADKSSPADLTPRLSGFDNDGSDWRGAAREIIALAAYRTADYALADRYANSIVADAALPVSLRERAKRMVALLTPLLPVNKAK